MKTRSVGVGMFWSATWNSHRMFWQSRLSVNALTWLLAATLLASIDMTV